MTQLEVIERILEENYIHPEQGKLIEEDTDVKGNKFKVEYKIISNLKLEYKLYRYDDKIFPFFSEGVPALKKMCDYILFCQDNRWLFVFIIELKLGTESAGKQLNAAEIFIEFIINSAKRIGEPITNIDIRKIRISDRKIRIRQKQSIKSKQDYFDFDSNKYLDYRLDKLYLQPLTQLL